MSKYHKVGGGGAGKP